MTSPRIVATSSEQEEGVNNERNIIIFIKNMIKNIITKHLIC